MKIMIVDDHADMRRVLKNIVSLSASGHVEFIECESGEEALGRYILHHPELVLMDVELKEIDGFETIQKIYTQDPDAKVIVITSFDRPSFRKKAKHLEVYGFIAKDKLSDINHLLKTI